MDGGRPVHDLCFGPFGQLTYVPSPAPTKQPGQVFTTRILSNDPAFSLLPAEAEIWSLAEITGGPPKRRSDRPRSQAIGVQKRWLQAAYPEATDLDQLYGVLSKQAGYTNWLLRCGTARLSRDLVALAYLKASGPANTNDDGDGVPVLAKACGGSGERLRLQCLVRSAWAWHKQLEEQMERLEIEDNKDGTAGQTEWQPNDVSPIYNLKFAAASDGSGEATWLIVQNQTSTFILELKLIPDDTDALRAPARIKINRVVAIIPTTRTGGHLHTDVALTRDGPGRNRVAIVDERGCWTILDICPNRAIDILPENAFSILHQGHTQNESVPSIASQPVLCPQHHGVLWTGVLVEDSGPASTGSVEDSSGTVRQLLRWNEAEIVVEDPNRVLRWTPVPPVGRKKQDLEWIRDVEPDPVRSSSRIFALTTHQLLWIDLSRTQPSADGEQSFRPQTLILARLQPRPLRASRNAMRCRAWREAWRENEDRIAVLVYAQMQCHWSLFWFCEPSACPGISTFRSDVVIPGSDVANRTPGIQTILSLPVAYPLRVHHSAKRKVVTIAKAEPVTKPVHFRQILVQGSDLSVRSLLAVSGSASALNIGSPAFRLGAGTARDRARHRRKRIRTAEEAVVSDEDPLVATMDKAPTVTPPVVNHQPRVRKLNYTKLAAKIQNDLLQMRDSWQTTAGGTDPFDRIAAAMQQGIYNNELGLKTFLDLAGGMDLLNCGPAPESWMPGLDRLLQLAEGNLWTRRVTESPFKDMQDLVGTFSRMWLDGLDETQLPPDARLTREAMIKDTALRLCLSSYAAMAPNVFDPTAESADQPEPVEEPERGSLPHGKSKRSRSHSHSQSTEVAHVEEDGALRRLRTLAKNLGPARPRPAGQADKVLAFWPEGAVTDWDEVDYTALFDPEQKKMDKTREIDTRRKEKLERRERRERPPLERERRGSVQGPVIVPAPSLLSQIMSEPAGQPSSLQVPASDAAPQPLIAMSQQTAGVYGGRETKKVKRMGGRRVAAFR